MKSSNFHFSGRTHRNIRYEREDDGKLHPEKKLDAFSTKNFFLHSKDIERDFKANHKEKKITNEKLESLETDVNHIMGRGETSNVSGIPTLNRLS